MEPYVWYPQRTGRVDLVLERARASGKLDDPVVRQEIARLLSLAKSVEWDRPARPRRAEPRDAPLEAGRIAREAGRQPDRSRCRPGPHADRGGRRHAGGRGWAARRAYR